MLTEEKSPELLEGALRSFETILLGDIQRGVTPHASFLYALSGFP